MTDTPLKDMIAPQSPVNTSQDKSIPPFLIVDASGLIYRSFYAVRALTSPTGEPTGALYGFIRSLIKTIQDLKPSHIVSVFDGPNNKQSRLSLYPEYKAHRKPTPPELIHQIGEAKRFCSLSSIPFLNLEGVEADDVIASTINYVKKHDPLFHKGNSNRIPIYILSADKDLMQLVGDGVYIINPMKDYLQIDEKKAFEEWGLTPKQIRDYLAIVGDSSDNVPGVDGLGPKAAMKLIEEWGSVEEIYRNIDKVQGKTKEKLEKGKEDAFLSLQLVTLQDALELPIGPQFFERKDPYLSQEVDLPDDVSAFFLEKGFKSLLPAKHHVKSTYVPPSRAKEGDLFSSQGGELKLQQSNLFQSETTFNTPPPRCDVKIIASEEGLSSLFSWIITKKNLVVDCETTSLDEHTAEIVGLGLGADEKLSYYVDFAKGDLDPYKVIKAISDLMSQHAISLIGHNCKYDLHILVRYGLSLPHISFDTLVGSWLLSAHERTHSLDDLAKRYFGIDKIPIESLIGKASRGKPQSSMRDAPQEEIARYCAEDVEYTYRLYALFKEKLSENEALNKLFHTIEMPLLPILFSMEREGIYLNADMLSTMKSAVESQLSEAREKVYKFAGEEFNLNSPKQLGQILYTKLAIPPLKKGKTAFSTDAEVLEELSLEWPIAEAILEYRQLEKLRSTYIEALPKSINPLTGRIHCRFIQSGTATGRLSCQDPNLQNIPVRGELGKGIRAAFQPQHPGWSFVSFDYSQIELRVLAHMSDDKTLIDAFMRGLDIHTITAKEIFHVKEEEVTEEMRRRAKAVNFGVIYGQKGFGLSKELHISLKEANQFIDAYFRRYPSVEGTIERAKEEARSRGYSETLTGRRRFLPDIRSSNHVVRSLQERLAVNTPIQGTAADIIKMAMIAVDNVLKSKKYRTKMLLQIHDELLFEMPDEEKEELIPRIQEAMEQVMPELKVPLKVDIGIGKNWKEC